MSWQKKNDRRLELIDKEVYWGLTEEEHKELEALQAESLERTRLKHPLPALPEVE